MRFIFITKLPKPKICKVNASNNKIYDLSFKQFLKNTIFDTIWFHKVK